MVFKLYGYNLIKAQAPPRLVSTPNLIMCKVFDNHHILWIDKWVHYNPNRPHLSPQTILKVSRKYLVTGGVQKIPLGCVWGSSPTQIGSHIHLNLNRVQGVWQSSGDAVDGHMEHHHLITTTLGTADLECELKLLVTGGTWKISLCCDWGWRPTHIGSHHS